MNRHSIASRQDASLHVRRWREAGGRLTEGLARLNLAIGLLGRPQLLLLDEPTVGVDPQSRHFLLESIAALPAAGTTVIYTSHYMKEVEAIGQQIAIIDQGTVLATGRLADILSSPEPLLEIGLDRELPADIAIRHAASASGELKYVLKLPSPAALPRLLDELAAAGCAVRQLNCGQHDREQVFMRLTKRSLRD